TGAVEADSTTASAPPGRIQGSADRLALGFAQCLAAPPGWPAPGCWDPPVGGDASRPASSWMARCFEQTGFPTPRCRLSARTGSPRQPRSCVAGRAPSPSQRLRRQRSESDCEFEKSYVACGYCFEKPAGEHSPGELPRSTDGFIKRIS